MDLRAGTSGFAYKEWKGPFYPEDLPADGMLGHYAGRLPAVEINNTFYRLPREGVLAGWAAAVPAGFRFSIKASRKITHFGRLAGVEGETRYLLDAVGALGDKLGALLFQLPPNLRCDLERLTAFCALLPPHTPAAFEFRHPSWDVPEVAAHLASCGFARVVADTDEAPVEGPLSADVPWGYLRLRRAEYPDAALGDWAARVAATGWERAFVFFKHEDAGAGPRMAARFLEIAGG